MSERWALDELDRTKEVLRETTESLAHVNHWYERLKAENAELRELLATFWEGQTACKPEMCGKCGGCTLREIGRQMVGLDVDV